MAFVKTTTAWGMPIWLDESTGEQVSDPNQWIKQGGETNWAGQVSPVTWRLPATGEIRTSDPASLSSYQQQMAQQATAMNLMRAAPVSEGWNPMLAGPVKAAPEYNAYGNMFRVAAEDPNAIWQYAGALPKYDFYNYVDPTPNNGIADGTWKKDTRRVDAENQAYTWAGANTPEYGEAWNKLISGQSLSDLERARLGDPYAVGMGEVRGQGGEWGSNLGELGAELAAYQFGATQSGKDLALTPEQQAEVQRLLAYNTPEAQASRDTDGGLGGLGGLLGPAIGLGLNFAFPGLGAMWSGAIGGGLTGALTGGDPLKGALLGGAMGYAGGQLFGGAEGATSGLGYENAFDSGAMANAMGGSSSSAVGGASGLLDQGLTGNGFNPIDTTNLSNWNPQLTFDPNTGSLTNTTDLLNNVNTALGQVSGYNPQGFNDNFSQVPPGDGRTTQGGPPDLPPQNQIPDTPLDPKKLADLAKSAMGLLGGGTPQQSQPLLGGGGSSGYSANIQPDMGLLSLNKPQYANIFQTQALQPIYGSQRGY